MFTLQSVHPAGKGLGTSSESNTKESVKYFLKTKTNFLTAKSIKEERPAWNLSASIQASKQDLLRVDYVVYRIFLTSGEPKDQPPIYSHENGFLFRLIIFGDFPLTAILFLKNGTHLSLQSRIVAIIPSKFINMSPVQFNFNPYMVKSKVTINGTLRAKVGVIKYITVDWGDGNKTANVTFPISHNYSKVGSYTIKVNASTRLGLFSKTINTDLLSIGHIILPGATVSIVKGQYMMTLYSSSPSISDNSPETYVVSGNLLFVNGSGIRNEPINIRLLSNDAPSLHNDTYQLNNTDKNGHYFYKNDNLHLEHGRYKVSLFVPSGRYAGINVTKEFDVIAHPLPIEQLITYIATLIGIALAIFGIIIKVPSYFASKTQTGYLSKYLEQIERVYNEFYSDKSASNNDHVYTNKLQEIRSASIYLLQRRYINEFQFKMIDDKISDYQKMIGEKRNQH